MKRRLTVIFVAVLVLAFGAVACAQEAEDEVRQQVGEEVENARDQVDQEIQQGRTQIEEQVEGVEEQVSGDGQ